MSGISQISLNQRIQGSTPFIEVQSLEPSQLQINNSKLGLSEDVNVVGNLVVQGTINSASVSNSAIEVPSLVGTTSLTTPKIIFPDNQNAGLVIQASDNADYITLKSSDGAEQIQLNKTIYTAGNSLIHGTNSSRGTIQYANIVNSTLAPSCTINANSATATLLENARTIGGVSFNGGASINLNGVNQAGNQNTSGTASAWTSARTTNFTSLAGDALGSVSLSGTGTTTAQLKTPFYDESNANAKKLILSNTTSGHTSTGLQQRIDFANEFLPQMNQTDDLVGRLTMAKDVFSITQFLTNATNTSQATTFTRGDDSFPKMNGMLRFLQSSAGANISVERDGTFDGNADQKALPSGIDFKLGSGSYVGSGLGGLQGGIRSNYTATEIGNTKVFASSFVNNASREMSLLLKPDELSLTNMGIIKFNGAGTISSTDSNIALTPGSGKQVILGTKVRVGSIAEAGDEEANPYLMGIEDPTAINGNDADDVSQLLSFKYHISNGSQNRHFGFEGDQTTGGIQLVRNIFGTTANDGYTGTRTKTKLIQFSPTGLCSVNGAPLQDGLGLIQPTTGGAAMGFSHPNDTTRKWTFLVGSNYDCTFSGATGCNNLTFNGKARATLNAQGGIAALTGSTDAEITATSGDVKLTSGDDIIMTAGGGVGIGTTTPSEKIEIGGGNMVLSSLTNHVLGAATGVIPETPVSIKFKKDTDCQYGSYNVGIVAKISAVYDNNNFKSGSNALAFYTYYGRQAGGGDYTSEKMRISSQGYVGIGNTNPSYPLQVSTYNTPSSFYWNNYLFVGADTLLVQNGNRSDIPISIYAEKAVYSTYLIGTSDIRIKTDITVVDDGKALQQVLDLECKEYSYIDPHRRREHKTIGFIAQEVKEIIPNAVSLQIDFIPDELRVLEDLDWSGNVLTISDLVFEDNHTGKCKFYVSQAEEEGEEELTIECEKDEDGNKTNRFIFEKEWKHVFLHGKEISDFHALDKQMIFSLHHSSIQELDRNDKKMEEKILSLEQKVEALTKVIEDLSKTVKINENALKNMI